MCRKIILLLLLTIIMGCAQTNISSLSNFISGSPKAESTDKKPVQPFINVGHGRYVTSLAVSDDGKYAVSGGTDRNIKLWDMHSGRLIKTLGKQKDDVAPGIAISPDNRYIFSADTSVKTEGPFYAYKWDTHSGKLLKKFNGHNGGISSISLSPDGRYLVSAETHGVIIIYETAGGKIIKEMDIHKMSKNWPMISAVKFLPDGKRFLIGASDGSVFLTNFKGEVIRRFSSSKSRIEALDVTRDGLYFTVGHAKGDIEIWEMNTGKLINNFKFSNERVNALLFTPDYQEIQVLQNYKLSMIDFNTGKIIKKYKNAGSMYSMASTKNGSYTIGGGYTYINMLETQTGDIVRQLGGSFKTGAITPYALAVNPIKDQMLMGGVAKQIRVIQTSTLKETGLLTGHIAETTYISYTSDGKHVVTRSMDNTIKIWDTETLKEIKSIETGSEGAMVLSHDNRYAYAKNDKQIMKIDLKTGKKVITIDAHLKSITRLDISSDGGYLVSGSRDKTVKLWNTSDMKLLKTYEGHKDTVQDVKITNNGKYIVSCSGSYFDDDDSIRIWDTATGKELHVIKQGAEVRRLAVTPDSRYAISGADDNIIRVWDIKTGEMVNSMKGHESSIWALTLTPDGKYLISGAFDNTVKIWNLKTGENLLTSAYFRDGEWITITRDGFFDASSNGAKYLNILTGPMSVASIDQYYETFYRPDIVADTLKLGKTVKYAVNKPMITINEIKPAPDVKITDTPDETNKENLTVTLKITPNKGGIGQIRLYVDDTLIKTDGDRALKKKTDTAVYKTYSIQLPKGKHILKAVVFNETNTMSSKEAEHAVVSTFNPVKKPDIYAVVIGINDYKNPSIALRYAVSDAKLFADVIKSRTSKLFGNVNIHLLTSMQETTKDSILDTMQSMKSISADDLFIFFVASHGIVEDAKYHLITSNVGALSTRGINKESISQDELKDAIANIPALKKVLILDTCNSGAMAKAIQVALLSRGLTETTAMKLLSRAVGSTIISASSSQQEALEGYKGHGLLTYVLAEGLEGKADLDKDGYVKTREIANYVEDTVPVIAEGVFKRAQYPYISPIGSGFPIVNVN